MLQLSTSATSGHNFTIGLLCAFASVSIWASSLCAYDQFLARSVRARTSVYDDKCTTTTTIGFGARYWRRKTETERSLELCSFNLIGIVETQCTKALAGCLQMDVHLCATLLWPVRLVQSRARNRTPSHNRMKLVRLCASELGRSPLVECANGCFELNLRDWDDIETELARIAIEIKSISESLTQ